MGSSEVEEGARKPRGILLRPTVQGLEGSQAALLLEFGNVPKNKEAAARLPSGRGGADGSECLAWWGSGERDGGGQSTGCGQLGFVRFLAPLTFLL